MIFAPIAIAIFAGAITASLFGAPLWAVIAIGTASGFAASFAVVAIHLFHDHIEMRASNKTRDRK
jgi:hypothetical protein